MVRLLNNTVLQLPTSYAQHLLVHLLLSGMLNGIACRLPDSNIPLSGHGCRGQSEGLGTVLLV